MMIITTLQSAKDTFVQEPNQTSHARESVVCSDEEETKNTWDKYLQTKGKGTTVILLITHLSSIYFIDFFLSLKESHNGGVIRSLNSNHIYSTQTCIAFLILQRLYHNHDDPLRFCSVDSL